MRAGKMHADEVETDAALVRRLLAAQFPEWADLPIEEVTRVDGVGDGEGGRMHERAAGR